MNTVLKRQTFSTNRLMDFLSEKELSTQIGHGKVKWPLVIAKELIDNALDAAEDTGIAPDVDVRVDENSVTVSDNGHGIEPEAVLRILDFNVRVSSREAYVAPDRGAQGNALKTLIAMPYVLDGKVGGICIVSKGVKHEITCRADIVNQTRMVLT